MEGLALYPILIGSSEEKVIHFVDLSQEVFCTWQFP